MKALVVTLALLGALPAAAQTPRAVHPPASPEAVAPAAADQKLGMAIMSAVVSISGVLVRGAGAVSSARQSVGVFFVTFERSIRDCSFNATGGTTDATPSGTVAYFVGFYADDPKQIKVVGLNPITLNELDGPFHLLVFCPQ